jgi:hypothetical protein
MSHFWSIYIDIEGFGSLSGTEDQILWSLGELTLAVFRIGRLCYPHDPDRLFAHQVGDGFLVVSDFHKESLFRCATIATALMRHVAATGELARASISEGELSDVQGCYPEEFRECLVRDNTVSLHMGLMTISPVMGTALIRAIQVDKVAPRGPLLIIDSLESDRLGAGIPKTPIPDTEFVSIDWVHMDSELLSRIQQTSRLNSKSPRELEDLLRSYCHEQPVPEEWRENVYHLLGVPREGV